MENDSFADKLTIREATIDDAKIIYNLSNENEVRKYSINQNKIIWEDHLEWLKQKISKEDYYILLFFKEKDFVGQVKYSIDTSEATVSISISKEFRGKNLSEVLLKKSIERLKNLRIKIDKIFALIKPGNIISIRCFQKVGFRLHENSKINDELFYKYIYELNKNEKF